MGGEVEKQTKEAWRLPVGFEGVPVTIHHNSRVRFMLCQDAIDRFSDDRHVRGILVTLDRSVAGRKQKGVA
jgi:hypothetical protein